MDHWMLYFFSGFMLLTAFKTISHPHPAYGALYLAATMVLLSAVFFLMGAPFLAGLQLIIYAGAVMVLFVMVLMLFDFKEEPLTLFKKTSWIWPAFLFGLSSGLIGVMAFSSLPKNSNTEFFSATNMAFKAFHKICFDF